MPSIYPQNVLHELNMSIDVPALMKLIDYKFDKFQAQDDVYKGFCPIHCEGIFRNLVIEKNTHRFICQYNQCPGAEPGDLIQLYSLAKKISYDEAARQLVRDLALPITLPADETTAPAKLEEARGHLESADFDEARRILRELQTTQPDNEQVWLLLLDIARAADEPEPRIEALRHLVGNRLKKHQVASTRDWIQEWHGLQPDSPHVRLASAELIFTDGNFEDSVMEFMAAADACEAEGLLDNAIAAYKRVESISTENKIDVIDATPHIVRVLREAGRPMEAVAHLREHARGAMQRGEVAQAAEVLRMAMQNDPDSPTLRREFVEAVRQLTSWDDSLTEPLLQTVEFFLKRDEPDTALYAFEGVNERMGNQIPILEKLAEAYYQAGKPVEASNIEARLAGRYLETNYPDRAAALVDKILAWQPEHSASLNVLSELQNLRGDTESRRDTLRRLARSLLAQRQYQGALEAAKAMTDANPDDDEALDLRAAALEGIAKSGDDTDKQAAVETLESLADRMIERTNGRRAIQYLERAVDLAPDDSADLLFKLARAYYRGQRLPQVRDTVIQACEILAANDKIDQAILESERYSSLLPEDPDLVRYLAELYLRFDNRPKAVERLRRLSQQLAMAGKHDEADEVAEQARQLEPQDVGTILTRANHQKEIGQLEKFRTTLQQAAINAESQNKINDAAQLLEALLEDESNFDISQASHLATLYDSLGNEERSLHWRFRTATHQHETGELDKEAYTLRDLLTRHPEHERALAALLACEYQRRDVEAGTAIARRLAAVQNTAEKTGSARATLLEAVAKSPEDLDLHQDLFDLHLQAELREPAMEWAGKLTALLNKADRKAEATEIHRQLIKLNPDDETLLTRFVQQLENSGNLIEATQKRFELARLQANQGRLLEAEESVRQILAIDTQNLDAHRLLAELIANGGRHAEATQQSMVLAQELARGGETEEAAQLLYTMLETTPEDPEVLGLLASLLRESGKSEEAADTYKQLGALHDQLGQGDLALQSELLAAELSPQDFDFRKALANRLGNSKLVSEASSQWHLLARDYQAAQQFEDALECLDNALELDAERIRSRKLRAEILNTVGRSDEALEEYRALAELNLGSTLAPSRPDVDTPFFSYLPLVPEYTFENFVVGAHNDFAYATALAIARSPARAYNPLFLYADVGLGKTHLCNAVANYMMADNPNSNIIYTNTEDFTSELVHAIQNNSVNKFRQLYRNLDLLVVDDVQFLTGKERAQEEFFHIFNALFQAKRQIVITSDRPPSEIAHLEGRLRSRFGSGVIVDIASPDLETRIAILNRDVERLKAEVPPETTAWIAESIDWNVRELKGALTQVLTLKARHREVNQENVKSLLDSLYAPPGNVS